MQNLDFKHQSINLLQTRPQDTSDADEQLPHLSQIPVLQNPQDASSGPGSGTCVANLIIISYRNYCCWNMPIYLKYTWYTT